MSEQEPSHAVTTARRPDLPDRRLLRWLAGRSPAEHISMTLLLVLLVGLADYLLGVELSLLLFYVLPIGQAAWFVGRKYALGLAVASVAVWLAGDFAAGARFSNYQVVIWNASIAFGVFFIVIWLAASLRDALADLETRVVERTAALRREMAERARLENEVLEVAEREQQRIGHDLHDGLGQHLTGAALAGQVLVGQLVAQARPEGADAERVVGLIEEAIEMTRTLAHGLAPVAFEGKGLRTAFQDLRAYVTQHFQVTCRFSDDLKADLGDPNVSMHLYRIAQEAITNAVRHGRARTIDIGLHAVGAGGVKLSIADDGIGIPAASLRPGTGLGLRTMAHRAELMSAKFFVRPQSGGGTIVTCTVPLGAVVPLGA